LHIAIHSLIIGELIPVYSPIQTLKLKQTTNRQILLTRSRKTEQILTYLHNYLLILLLVDSFDADRRQLLRVQSI